MLAEGEKRGMQFHEVMPGYSASHPQCASDFQSMHLWLGGLKGHPFRDVGARLYRCHRAKRALVVLKIRGITVAIDGLKSWLA